MRADLHIISEGYIEIVQPDLANGRIIKNNANCEGSYRRKKLYCPHFLGGGIGLLASAHALAAAGGNGILEVDCNPNPLRTFFIDDFFNKSMSTMILSDEPGIGAEPDLLAIAEYRTK